MFGFWCLLEHSPMTQQYYVTVHSNYCDAVEHVRHAPFTILLMRADDRLTLNVWLLRMAERLDLNGFSLFPCELSQLRYN